MSAFPARLLVLAAFAALLCGCSRSLPLSGALSAASNATHM